MIRPGASFILLPILSGCTSLHVMSHVPAASLQRMWSLSPADIEPEELRVASRLPAALEPRPDGVKVVVTEAATRGGAPTRHTLVLEPATDAGEVRPLASHGRAGFRVWVYRLAAADVARVRQIRDRVAKGSSGGGSVAGGSSEGGGSIAAGVDACRRSAVGGAPLPSTVFLRTSVRAGYFMVIEDLDLRAVVSDAEFATKVPACP